MNFFYDKKNILTLFEGIQKREDIRKIIPLKYETFKKTPFSKNTSDFFGDLEVMCRYDENNLLSGVELYYPKAEFYFNEKQMLGIKLSCLIYFLKEHEVEYYLDGDSIIVDQYGLDFYIPEYDNEAGNAIVKSIYIKHN